MGSGWLPWSAASLASGAVLLVLGALSLPPTAGVAQQLEAVQGQGAAWLMAAVAFFLAAIALTLGLPTIVWLVPGRTQVSMLVGLCIWAAGTIGTAGLAALLLLFRAVVETVGITPGQLQDLSEDPSIRAVLAMILGSFYLGELVVTIVLLRSRVIARWVPTLLLVHVAVGPVNHLLPPRLQGVQAIVLGAGLMGIAVKAAETWAAMRTPSRL